MENKNLSPHEPVLREGGPTPSNATAEPAAAFTPGPWHLCHHLESAEKDASCPCGYRGGIWGSDGEHVVCEMGSTLVVGEEGLCPPRYPRPVELANARLIATAPELLAVAQRYEAWEANLVLHGRWEATGDGLPTLTEDLYDEMMELQALRNAAIAKATGQ